MCFTQYPSSKMMCFDPSPGRSGDFNLDLEMGTGFFFYSGFELASINGGDKSLLVGGFGVAYEGSCFTAGCYYPSNTTRFVDFGRGEEAKSWTGADMPQPRFGHCVTQINETTLMVMGGGHSFDTVIDRYRWNYTTVNSTLFYDIQEETWSQGPEMNLAKGKVSSTYGAMFSNVGCGTATARNSALKDTYVVSATWSENFANLTVELWSSSAGDWTLLPNIPCQIQVDVRGDPYRSFVDVFSFDQEIETEFDIYVLVTRCEEGYRVFGLDLLTREWSPVVSIEDSNLPDFTYGKVIPMTTARPADIISEGLAFHGTGNPTSPQTKLENGKCNHSNQKHFFYLKFVCRQPPDHWWGGDVLRDCQCWPKHFLFSEGSIGRVTFKSWYNVILPC